MTRYFITSKKFEDKDFCNFLQNHVIEEISSLIKEQIENIEKMKFTVKITETSAGIFADFYDSHLLVSTDRGSYRQKFAPKRFLTNFFKQYSRKIGRLYRVYVSLQ